MQRDIPIKAFDEIVPIVQNGDLIFCSGDYWFSKIIRKTTSSDYSHVGIAAKWNKQIMILEAVESDGIRAIPLRQYVTNFENKQKPYKGRVFLGRLWPPVSSTTYQRIWEEGIHLLNARYDFTDLIQFFFRFSLKLPIKYKPDQAFVCSEFVERCFAVGYNRPYFFSSRPHQFVSPSTIANHPTVRILYEIKS